MFGAELKNEQCGMAVSCLATHFVSMDLAALQQLQLGAMLVCVWFLLHLSSLEQLQN